MQVDEALFRAARIVPVIEIDDAALGVDLADAIHAGGLRLIELTLRSPAALPALRAIKAAKPALTVGMGTILTRDDAARALDAGADFLVTPGATERLLDGLHALGVAALPGVATLSEAMRAMEAGFGFMKFFPAETAGGVAALRAFAGPLAGARFCPTGGISAERAPDYLGLANVVCVGGSWVAPRAMVAGRDWAGISANAARAAAM